MQLELGLAEPPCPCCADEREVDPPYPCCADEREVDPPYPGMDPEPCAWCDEPAWWRWMADPYAEVRSDFVDRQTRSGYDWFRRPDSRGQLGLGIGNQHDPVEVTRA